MTTLRWCLRSVNTLDLLPVYNDMPLQNDVGKHLDLGTSASHHRVLLRIGVRESNSSLRRAYISLTHRLERRASLTSRARGMIVGTSRLII